MSLPRNSTATEGPGRTQENTPSAQESERGIKGSIRLSGPLGDETAFPGSPTVVLLDDSGWIGEVRADLAPLIRSALAEQFAIVTPLTYSDALRLATEANAHVGDEFPCVKCEFVAKALLAVDVASREQAQEWRRHDESTCPTCIAIKARRKNDEYGDSPSDDYRMPEDERRKVLLEQIAQMGREGFRGMGSE